MALFRTGGGPSAINLDNQFTSYGEGSTTILSDLEVGSYYFINGVDGNDTAITITGADIIAQTVKYTGAVNTWSRSIVIKATASSITMSKGLVRCVSFSFSS